MEVQIFMSEDNKELIYDGEQLAEFNKIVDELGLKCGNVKNKEKSPIPYLLLDDATIRAFKILCPSEIGLKKYRFEIPIEILRHAKLAETEHYFDSMEVWYNEKDPDPFLIGSVYKDDESKEKNWYWNKSRYLIGRWGAEAKEIPVLIKMAVHICTQRIKDYAESQIAKMTSWNTCPEVWAKRYIASNETEAYTAITSTSSILTDNTLPF